MNERHKTTLAFLGILAFLGLAIFFQSDITTHLGLETEQQEQPTEDFEASTEFTGSFESELGPEYVFDIETESLDYLEAVDGREHYQASLSFDLTDFGEAVAGAESEEEVEALVEESFESYPEDFAYDLIEDVEAVEEGRPEDLQVEELSGSLENVESSNEGLDLEVSFEEGGEMPELKFGSFSTTWSIEPMSEDDFVGGDGSESSPYEIEDWYHLDSVRDNLDAHFVLNNDLDSSTEGYSTHVEESDGGWDPIGDVIDDVFFEGTLDGQGYEVDGIVIDREDEYNAGLFSLVGDEGLVKDIGLVNADVSGEWETGALVGRLDGGVIENSFARGYVSGLENEIGGLVGMTIGDDSRIIQSYAEVHIESEGNQVGGLVGSSSGDIISSYADGNIEADDSESVGGLAGTTNGDVTSSYSLGELSGGSVVGGLAGRNNEGDVSNSFAANDVSAESNSGGLLGAQGGAGEANLINSYWDKSSTNQEDAVGANNGDISDVEGFGDLASEGPADEMRGRAAVCNMEGLDFTGVWTVFEDEYPELQVFAEETGFEECEPEAGSVVITEEGVVQAREGVIQTQLSQ